MAADLSPSFAAHHDGGGEAMSVLESLLLEEDLQTTETDDPTLWEKMAAVNPRRTPRELEEKFHAVLAENSAAILGLQHLPADHLSFHPPPFQLPVTAAPPASAMMMSLEPSLSRLVASLKQALPDRSTTKGVTWSDEEHRLFLLGMDLHGKGDWKSISRYFVVSRTPSQIASHAQKFFNRKMGNSDRRRASIHDVSSTAHRQNPFGSFQNMFTDGRLSYLGQLQMTLLGNRHMPPPPSARQQVGFNVN